MDALHYACDENGHESGRKDNRTDCQRKIEDNVCQTAGDYRPQTPPKQLFLTWKT